MLVYRIVKENEIQIDVVSVPFKHRGKKYATSLMNKLIEMYPLATIHLTLSNIRYEHGFRKYIFNYLLIEGLDYSND
jgi:hypothetical protein